MTIHEQENILLEEWWNSYPANERDNFVMDGLCYNGPLNERGTNSFSGNEEKLWVNTKRKIVFLMKDPNGNPGEDYRNWHWRAITAKFFKVIFNWLQGLNEITLDYTPLLENNSYFDPANQVVLKYPLAIVNVKKQSGISSVYDDVLYTYAERDASFLRRQIKDILQPNIIVCGGGTHSSMLDIAKRYIYPEFGDKFVKVNNWCYYMKEPEILLINSWHPSARVSDTQKIDDMMYAVSDLINKRQPNIFIP